MANFKWTSEYLESRELRVALFISRNKDNKDIEGFKERRKAFITKNDNDRLKEKFEYFVSEGVEGETSRLYVSVNARDEGKIRKALIIKLIEEDNLHIERIDSILAGISAESRNALTKRWLFDFDYDDNTKLNEFLADLRNCASDIDVGTYKTPHGYAVITDRGFDTRELLKKWNDVTLKRDDMLIIDWKTK